MKSTDNQNHTKLSVHNGGNVLFSLSDTISLWTKGQSPCVGGCGRSWDAAALYSIVRFKKSDTLLPEWNERIDIGSVTVIVGLLHTIQRPFRTHSINSYTKSDIRPEPFQKTEQTKLKLIKSSVLNLSYPCWRHCTKRRSQKSDKPVLFRPSELASLQWIWSRRADPSNRDLFSNTFFLALLFLYLDYIIPRIYEMSIVFLNFFKNFYIFSMVFECIFGRYLYIPEALSHPVLRNVPAGQTLS